MAIKHLQPQQALQLKSASSPLPARDHRIETYVPGAHWIIEAEFPDERKVWGTAISINLKIDPGITPREWRAAQDLSSRLLPERNRKRSKPTFSPEMEEMLQRAFETVGIPNETQTQAAAVLAIVHYMSHQDRPVPISSVQKRYTLWLTDQGFGKK
jgi:hypothetical protein